MHKRIIGSSERLDSEESTNKDGLTGMMLGRHMGIVKNLFRDTCCYQQDFSLSVLLEWGRSK